MAGRFSITRREEQMAEQKDKGKCDFQVNTGVYLHPKEESDDWYYLCFCRGSVSVNGCFHNSFCRDLAEWTPAEFFGIIERAIAEKRAEKMEIYAGKMKALRQKLENATTDEEIKKLQAEAAKLRAEAQKEGKKEGSGNADS
jgi:hypothetical protein